MKQCNTHITFWGGVETIGGSIVSLQKENYRIITDFGAYVGADVEALLDPSQTMTLLQQEQLPNIPQFYEENDIHTIVCLTHLHLDHLGSLNHLPSNVEVWLSEESYIFYKGLRDSEYLPDYYVTWRPVRWRDQVEFGPFTLQFHPSDHDTLGAAAIFIETDDLKVVQSGDFRLSGFHPDKVWRWAENARKFKPDLLLIEGTAFSFHSETEPTIEPIEQAIIQPHLKTEKALLKEVRRLAQEDKVLIYNGYPQNIERLIELIHLMEIVNRQVIVSPDMYNLLNQVAMSDLSIIPWSDDLLETIRQVPEDYFVQIDSQDTWIFEVLPAGIYLHSNGMPLGNFMPGYIEFVTKVVHGGWQFINLSVSGHAAKRDLLTISYLIDAYITVGWHTFGAKDYQIALQTLGLEARLPKVGQTYLLSELNHLKINEEK